MIEIKNFATDAKYLTLEYSVRNPFPYDIWVCEDIYADAPSLNVRTGLPQDVETRIMGETLRMRLRFDLEHNWGSDTIFGRYRRLPQDQSFSGRIRVSLPVMNWSPFYVDQVDLDTAEKHITLRRVVFEIGYFSEDLPTLISQSKERGWHVSAWQPASQGPQTQLIADTWDGRHLEQSVQTVIDHVDVPGRLGDWLKYLERDR